MSRPGSRASTATLYRRLWNAAQSGDLGAVLSLIDESPDLRRYQGDAGTPVEMLAEYAPSLLESALEAGLSPNDCSGRIHQTPLQKAAARGDLDQMRLLLRFGADLERRNCHGETTLGYAASWGHLDAVRLIVDAGADINAIEVDPETGYRATALDSCEFRHPDVAEYLRSLGGKALREIECEAPTSPSAEQPPPSAPIRRSRPSTRSG